jgi:hypothetical protein
LDMVLLVCKVKKLIYIFDIIIISNIMTSIYYSKYTCITFMCFLVVVFAILGTVLYINHCNMYFGNKCNSNSINCGIINHYIIDATCTNDDYDAIYNCYQLIINCTNNMYSCNMADGYFSSYANAVNYFENNYYHNETIIAYVLDNNQTCSLKNPISYSVSGTFGFFSIVSSIILAFIIIIIICRCCIIKRRINSNYLLINQSTAYETNTPPCEYETFSNECTNLPPNYMDVPPIYTVAPPKY